MAMAGSNMAGGLAVTRSNDHFCPSQTRTSSISSSTRRRARCGVSCRMRRHFDGGVHATTQSSSVDSRRTNLERSSEHVDGLDRRVREKQQEEIEQLREMRLATALKTPYKKDGTIDSEAWKSLVAYQIEGGADGLVVAGTTGEGHLMNWREHIDLIRLTLEQVRNSGDAGKNFKVVGYTGSNSTQEAYEATKEGFNLGMHAALQINPYYGKTSLAGLRRHFGLLLDMGPTIVYNVPPRTNQDILPELMEELAQSPNFVGVKECVGNDRVLHYTRQGMAVWSGNDDQFHEARWKHQARGVISVVSNLVPSLVSKLLEEENSEANEKLLVLVRWLFSDFNPIGVNTALAQLGVVQPVFRLPYCPFDLEMRQEFVRIVETIGRKHFVGDEEVRVLADGEFIYHPDFSGK